MTRFEELKNMNIEEAIDWIDKNINRDDSPWDNWFNRKYCLNCPTITKKVPSILCEDHMVNQDYSFCELNGYCRYFRDTVDVLDNKTVLRMWLQEEIETNN